MVQPSVPRIIPVTIWRFAQQERLDANALFRDLPHARLSARMQWDDCAELFARLERARPDALARFAEYYLTKFTPVSVLASYFASPEIAYRVMFFAWARLWPTLGFKSEGTPQGWRLTARVDDRCRECAAFFRLIAEIVRRIPRLVRHPDAVVECDVSERAAEWRVRGYGATAAPRDDVSPGEIVKDAFGEMFGVLDEAGLGVAVPPEWGLTPAEERVVAMIASGKSIGEVMDHLAIARETVRTHVKRAMSKAGVHRQTELLALLYRSR